MINNIINYKLFSKYWKRFEKLAEEHNLKEEDILKVLNGKVENVKVIHLLNYFFSFVLTDDELWEFNSTLLFSPTQKNVEEEEKKVEPDLGISYKME